ncbi:helix-turn-helix domain-containing protein [Paenibacillus antri]|uniref:helix-turn-helix domain-containing protein n=1 Tax=Paenibacillus antri TaxID=2582848 RepID=UPI0013052771|nr:helix-turn-helix domain-containing protein [Paenibacillus antri]
MLGRPVIKNRSLFLKLLLAMTTLIVVTVILISWATYSISADTSVRNSIEYNESMLVQQRELVQKELDAVKNVVSNIMMTQSYLYRTINGRLSVGSLIDLTKYIEEQSRMSPYIDSIYLYYDELGIVLSSRNDIKMSAAASFEDGSWLTEMERSTGSRTAWLTGRPDGFRPDGKATSLLQKMPLIGDLEGAIVVNLKMDALFGDYLSYYKNKKGQTLVVGPDRAPLYGESGFEPADAAALVSAPFEGGTGYSIDRGERIVTYTVMPATGWTFVNVTKRSDLLASMNRIKTIVIAVSAGYVLAAFAIAFFVSRSIYHPIRSLIAYIGGVVPASEAGGTEAGAAPTASDEASFIRRSFERLTTDHDRMASEKTRIESLLAEHRTAIREKLLHDLIRGVVSERADAAGDDADAAEAPLPLRVDFARFAAVTFELEDDRPKEKEDAWRLHLLPYRLMEPFGNEPPAEIFAKDDARIVVLLSVPVGADHAPLELAKTLKHDLLERFGLVATFGVSRVHSGKPAVRAAFEETVEALHHKIYIGAGEILSYAAVSGSRDEDRPYHYPYESEKRLLQALLQSNEAECGAIVEDISREVIDRKLGKSAIQQLYFQLGGEIVKTVARTGGDAAAIFGEQSDAMLALSRAQTVREMERCIRDMCALVLEHNRVKRERMNDVTLRLAMEFMENHYNNNISVDTVADYVQRSTSFLSRIFKEATGQTVNDYLIQLRIRRAKELLANPALSLEDICRDIGYANVSYFSKLFKSRTGLTPGQFRIERTADKLRSEQL